MSKLRSHPGRSAAEFLPDATSVSALRRAAVDCRGCDLYLRATQTVFGEGATRAALMLVGEQPGDLEDRAGHPFVGPAGNLLNRALAEAHIARDEIYVTNAVKHFKWDAQGKRRKHKRPSSAEVAACRPWLTAEIQAVHPRIVVCLGVIAAQSILERTVRLTAEGGKFHDSQLGILIFLTMHPASVLRQPDEKERDAQFLRLVHDFKLVRQKLLSLHP
jgi:DNA polymerase